ncbi:hypothetical protein ACT1UH_00650 [Mycoplasma sp. 332]|uniref:hypothetical protein n=1 Tax=unclassified Asterococcus (in: mycoplasmas, genus) TaxID=3407551 RepID=UPI003F65B80A
MNDKFIEIVITTPNCVYYQGKGSIVTFTTTEGQIGLMKDAVPFLAALVPSQIIIKDQDNNNRIFYIDRGIVEFRDNLLSLIVNNIDVKPIDTEIKFKKTNEKKYTIIEEVVLKKKLAEQNKKL